MTNKNKQVELTTRQVQEINNLTGNGRFNAQQQQAILEAITVALNPDQYEDAEPDKTPAKSQKDLDKEQAERDAEAVKVAQAQAQAMEDAAEPHLNVLNQGNADQVTETTRRTVAEQDRAKETAQTATVTKKQK